VLFGFAPAFQARRAGVDAGMKQSGRSSTGARGTRLKNALIVTELSLALVVLIASGLLIKGLRRMYGSDPGFDPRGVVTVHVTLPEAKYKDLKRADAFFDDVLERIRGVRGVESTAASWTIPYDGNTATARFAAEDRPLPSPTDASVAIITAVTPGFFKTMRIRLLRGRVFSELDRDGSPLVAVINQTMAQQVWPGQDPVGRSFRYGLGLRAVATVTGVVRDINGITDLDYPVQQFYLTNAQTHSRGMALIVRCPQACPGVGDGIRSAVFAADRAQPVSELQTLEEVISVRRAPTRIIAQVTGFFAALALFLAAMGTYAVLAYSVAARRQEFGIRMALGAATHDLVALVMRQGIKLAAAGLGIGLMAAFAAMRLLAFMLYHVSPTDPPTFAAITLLLLAVAALACYVPASRAARINPTQALRYE
jgi:putative ABC transport system permease protein